MRKIAVIGLGKFGSCVARELADLGAQVIALDRREERVEAIKDDVGYAATLNATDEQALKAVGIQDLQAAVVCIGADVEANLLSTLLLKNLGVPHLWARAISPLQQQILKAMKVETVVNLEEEMGKLTARSLVVGNMVRHIQLGPGFSFAEITLPESLAGKTLGQSRIREDYHLNVVALKKKKPAITPDGERTFEEFIDNVPEPGEPLTEGTILILAGKDDDLVRFAEE